MAKKAKKSRKSKMTKPAPKKTKRKPLKKKLAARKLPARVAAKKKPASKKMPAPNKKLERELEEGLRESFPASDPVAVTDPVRNIRE